MRKKLVLASQSPRRRELMTYFNLPFEVVSPNGAEIFDDHLSITQQIESIAFQKAKVVFEQRPNNIIIGADTVVVIDGDILGKPKTPEVAIEMLKRLSGRTHEVLTSVALISSEKEIVFTSVTEVEFYDLDEQDIIKYVESGEPLDKAGAYTIQAGGALFVKGIRGDYYTVMGFPIGEIGQFLKNNQW